MTKFSFYTFLGQGCDSKQRTAHLEYNKEVSTGPWKNLVKPVVFKNKAPTLNGKLDFPAANYPKGKCMQFRVARVWLNRVGSHVRTPACARIWAHICIWARRLHGNFLRPSSCGRGSVCPVRQLEERAHHADRKILVCRVQRGAGPDPHSTRPALSMRLLHETPCVVPTRAPHRD